MNVFIFFQRVVHRNASFCVDEDGESEAH